MDIMMRLKGAGFAMIANEFREREKQLGGGLPLQDFVAIVLQGLPRTKSAEEKYANVSALVDLFDEIDINGDGAMEFDEFTSFCVDAGMVATRGVKSANLKHRYVRDAKRVIKTANGCVGIEKVKWSREFRKLLAIENTAKSVKLFDCTGKFLAEVGGKATLHVLPVTPRANERQSDRYRATSSAEADRGSSGRGSTHTTSDRSSSPTRAASASSKTSGFAMSSSAASTNSSTAGSGVFILDAVFIFKHQWLALSTTDFVISFYDMNESRKPPIATLLPDSATAAAKSGPSFELIKALTITTTTAQLLLRFCEHADLLFSSGNDFVLNVWKIIDAETKVLWKRLVLHQEMIMDLIEVPQHDMLVSCDLQRSIQLWDIHDCRSRGALVGHAHGVKQLVYSAHHDLLLSAGFEFDAYGWDIASRQIVMRLAGHRAPLVGVQIALFQTERAVTADCMGVFKVWDISRSNTLGGGAPGLVGGSRGGGMASQAIQLESIDPSQHFARFEPTAFVCTHPLSRDLWTATAGTATLHCFRSMRVQQLDEIPLRAFYHYSANKFIVVSGPVCSIWDGETGTCLEEFTHVGSSIGSSSSSSSSGDSKSGGGNSSSASAAGPGTSGAAGSSNAHNGSGSATGAEPCVEVLSCVQDQNCKKLVVVSERGDLGVFNALNFVQMRKCREVFFGSSFAASTSDTSSTANATPPPVLALASKAPTCGIVGLHYCSVNKLIVATDANESAILVIDDNTNHESARGMKETTVLRRLTNIPGGIAASAYGFHVCLVATISELDSDGNSSLSLWDFETLSFVGHCEFVRDVSAEATGGGPHALHLLEFWDDFPVLLSADTLGGIYFYAATPLIHCHTGQLLHSFANNDDTRSGHEVPSSDEVTSKQATRASDAANGSIVEGDEEREQDNDADGQETDSSASNKTFITEATEAAARKMLRWRKAKPSAASSASTGHTSQSGDDPQLEQKKSQQQLPASSTAGCAVTSMKVVHDDANSRYVLVTGDERGVVRLWDLSKMAERLSLGKIPEIKCKYLRRGYHPKAMFTRDFLKDAAFDESAKLKSSSSKHHQALLPQGGDWRTALLAGDDSDPHFQLTQGDLKRLSRRRLESKKRSTAVVPSLGGKPAVPQQQSAAARAMQQAATANAAFAAAEAFFGGGQQRRKGTKRGGKVVGFGASSSPSKMRGSLLGPSARASMERRRSRHDEHPNDIELVHAWQAHSDGVTSIEVSKNPDILVTCALDMRVFVWSWQGRCLGKLFDAENIGRWTWQFTKDDSKRQAERDALVTSLIRDLELTPLEKAHKRRQTLYQEHTSRKSLKDLQRVNMIVLDHIISKNPELDLLKTTEGDSDAPAAGDATLTSDEACAHNDQQHQCVQDPDASSCQGQDKCSPSATHATAPSDQLSQQPPLPETKQTHLRLHSLAQVGPLLCVNKFEYKNQSRAAVSKTRFAELDDLRMDKKYLEQELSISFPSSSSLNNSALAGSSSSSSLNDVHSQIEGAHIAAKAAFEARATLERKTTDMYVNLELVKQRTKGPLHESYGLGRTGRQSSSASLDELLEPSEFLKQHLPASKLAIRPQTAPGGHKRLQQLKVSALEHVRDTTDGDSDASLSGHSHPPPHVAGLTKSATASGTLPSTPSSRLHGSSSTPVLASSRQPVALDRRKSSLDIGFIEEVKRHAKRKPVSGNCGLPLSTSGASTGATALRRKSVLGQAGSGHARRESSGSSNSALDDPLQSADANDASADDGTDNGLSLRKLRAINQILSKAQEYCSPSREVSARPITAPFSRVKAQRRGSDTKTTEERATTDASTREHSVHGAEDNDDDAGEEAGDSFDTEGVMASTTTPGIVDDATTRAHLEETKRKMAIAMRDGERSPHRSEVQKVRKSVQQQQKVRRMEDYLQQKRREMNTNIGNVFKRTSFAFQSKASDDPMAALVSASGDRGASSSSGTGTKNGDVSATRSAGSKLKQRQIAGVATAANTASASLRAKVELEKSATVFGIYGVREVMSVIRLFWSMDADGSGSISLEELLQYKHFFEKLGYNDMATVFQAIDKDGNGHVSLKELLEICFHYATKYQLEEMLKLAKVGNVRSYLQGNDGSGAASGNASSSDPAASLSPEHRRELLDIFRVFDKNGDGGVSMQELMEALRVDDDDVIAKVMAEQAAKRQSTASGRAAWDAASPSGITKEDVERLYRDFDANRNATLDFDEFVALMRTLYGPKSNVYFR